MKRGSVLLVNDVALAVLKKRYFKKDAAGNCIETWDQMVQRVVDTVCANEDEAFRKAMSGVIHSTEFLPNSPCLVNAGNPVGGLSACFVTASPEDSWEGMTDNLRNFGYVARRGGGCGVNFSTIRPALDPVFGSTHAKACGPIAHMEMISEVMSRITQAGFRGMANMGVLDVHHPDIESFIVCKQHPHSLKVLLKEDIFGHYAQLNGKTNEQANILLDKFLSNFNISVLADDDFMNAVLNGGTIDLVFKSKVYATVKAVDIFDKIVFNAWANGDPGMLFYTAINDGPYKYSKQELTATNPYIIMRLIRVI